MSLTDSDLRFLKTELNQVKTDLASEFLVQLERVETTLLTEFQKWASPLDTRVRSYGGLIHALEENYASLAERVKNLEDRLPRPQ
jgi:hypothetical protein